MHAIEERHEPALHVGSRGPQEKPPAARAILAGHTAAADAPLTEDQLRGLNERVGGIMGLLDRADPDERWRYDQAFGLRFACKRLDGDELV
jgi:hypothetical protein